MEEDEVALGHASGRNRPGTQICTDSHQSLALSLVPGPLLKSVELGSMMSVTSFVSVKGEEAGESRRPLGPPLWLNGAGGPPLGEQLRGKYLFKRGSII